MRQFLYPQNTTLHDIGKWRFIFIFLKVILMTVSIEQSNNYNENSPENYPNL